MRFKYFAKTKLSCVHHDDVIEITLIDVIGDTSESVVDEVDLKMQVIRLYNKMKSVLKNREKVVLELRYGLLNGASKTQREVANMLGISRSYV